MSNNKCQVFVSHSSKDTTIVKLIELAFVDSEIKPYFAGLNMEGKNPVEKIVAAIKDSICIFALVTPNVMADFDTRDWVVFELGVGKGKNKEIFCWMDKIVEAQRDFPVLLNYVTDYQTFKSQEDSNCIDVVKQIREKAFSIAGLRGKNSDNVVEQMKIGLIQTEKAQEFEYEHPKKMKNGSEYESSSKKENMDLLPDSQKIDELNIDNILLGQIYEQARNHAESKNLDAKLNHFSILVYPFSDCIPKVTIYMDFYSKLTNKQSTFRFSSKIPYVEHVPPDKDVLNDLDKKVFKNLPWKVSPNWKQFLKIAVAKEGRLGLDAFSLYHLLAFAFGNEDLGKTEVFWSFVESDNYSGKQHLIRWNGLEINEQSIKQDY